MTPRYILFALSCFVLVNTEAKSQVTAPPSVADSREWDEVLQRLEATERTNRELLQRLSFTEQELQRLRDVEADVHQASVLEDASSVDMADGGSDTAESRILQAGFTSTSAGSLTECGCGSSCGCSQCYGGGGVFGNDLAWRKGDWLIVPYGRLRGEAIYSTASQTADAVTVFLNPVTLGISEDQATVHAKQSQINVAVTGPAIGDWQTGGVLATNFMGSQPLRNFSGANIILAYGEVKNEDWRFAFGRMLDLFGPISPTTVNQLSQRGAGNIGIYRGVMHLDRYVTMSDEARLTLSSRISQQAISDYNTIPQVKGKDNGWPNIEARVGLELGAAQDFGRPFEVGISGVIGEAQAVAPPLIDNGFFFPAIGEVIETRGVCLDLRLKSPRWGLQGEVWTSSGAGTYFAGVLQSLNPLTGQAIRSTGGWGEISYKCWDGVTMHVGYGVDDPRDAHLGFIDPVNGVGQIRFNDVGWWNVMWDVTDFFVLEFEISRRRTRYLAESADNQGTLFRFASSLKF